MKERLLIRKAKGFAQRLYFGNTRPGTTIIVAGIQRSGTNMLMSVLGRSWHTDVYHETDDRAFDDYSLRSTETLEHLHTKSSAPFFVLKALQDAHRVKELCKHNGNSWVIWPYRNYDDMVNSHLVSWPGFRERMDEIANGDLVSSKWRTKGVSESTLHAIRQFEVTSLNTASCVALFWYMRNQVLFDQSLTADCRTLVVRYEDIVTRPADTLKAICNRTGIPYSSRLHSIIHSKSVKKRAAPDIDPQIRQMCEKLAEQLKQHNIEMP